QGSGIFVTAADAGQEPRVNVYNSKDGSLKFSFLAYDQSFRGGVRVALGDVNGDGTKDIITGAGPGGGANVKVFSGVDGTLLNSFFPYDPSFAGGVFVAADDFAGDGFADIVTGAGFGGGPHVKIFSSTANGLDTINPIASFFAYGAQFTGGVTVA